MKRTTNVGVDAEEIVVHKCHLLFEEHKAKRENYLKGLLAGLSSLAFGRDGPFREGSYPGM